MIPNPAVQADSFLTLHYRLSGGMGDVINTFLGHPATLSMGTGQLAPALENLLLGLHEGAQHVFDINQQDAHNGGATHPFGQHQPQMVQWLAYSELLAMGDATEKYTVGDVLHFPTPDGLGQFAGLVLAVKHDTTPDLSKKPSAIQLDFNHPLAGKSLVFEVKILGVL